jgi:hypothetical protein
MACGILSVFPRARSSTYRLFATRSWMEIRNLVVDLGSWSNVLTWNVDFRSVPVFRDASHRPIPVHRNGYTL